MSFVLLLIFAFVLSFFFSVFLISHQSSLAKHLCGALALSPLCSPSHLPLQYQESKGEGGRVGGGEGERRGERRGGEGEEEEETGGVQGSWSEPMELITVK